jgi:predicted ribosome quality control (RQC) complex YloA/Tae2 family protein
MKYYILKELTRFLSKFKLIKHIKRVDNNTLKIEFSRDDILYFDMTKSNSTVYKKDSNDNIKKDFNAPFDVILQRRFTNSKIDEVYLRNEDKILCIKTSSKSAYKTQSTVLQLEFTGKNTNAIILEEDDTVLEALRHIDEWTSSRVVKTGTKLIPLEKPDFVYEIKAVDNIEQYLCDIYKNKELNELKSIKKQKILQIDKNIKKVQKILNTLEDVQTLERNAEQANEKGSLILNELYKYQGYEKKLKIKESNDLFTKSKKAKQKAKNQYIEYTNLSQKLEFYRRLKKTIQECETINDVEFYIPKKDKNQIKTKKANPYQSFFIDGYKIMLGRDERENIYLLENSKASDFWFHLQGQVSSHVIVSNTKKSIPEKIIEEAAKICARFSTQSGGVYSVDFTQRRNVKIQTKANVLYNPYSTVVVKI